MVVMFLCPKLSSSGVWCVENTKEQLVYVMSSSNILFAVSNLQRKLHYKDHCLPPKLIQDYYDNKLSFKVLEYVQDDPILLSTIKIHFYTEYSNNGWGRYSSRGVVRYFASLVPINHVALNGEERLLVHVQLKCKAKTVKPYTVGVFSTIKEAKEWCKRYYGEYDKYAVRSVVMCSSKLTRDTLRNPLLMDKNLLKLYKKVYEN
jgi:hypothetical protein